jgi:hypothetical protein
MAANASKRSVGEVPVAGSIGGGGGVVVGAVVAGAVVAGAVVVVVVVDVEAGTATFARGVSNPDSSAGIDTTESVDVSITQTAPRGVLLDSSASTSSSRQWS